MNNLHKITSRDNANIKFAKRVRDGRDPDHVFIEGLRLIQDALSSGVQLTHVFISTEAIDSGKAEKLLGMAGCEIFDITGSLADSIADTTGSQGIIAIADRPEHMGERIFADIAEGRCDIPAAVYLIQAGNPSNLGAIVRIVEAAGAAGLILSPGSADPYSPKALRGSMGSAFRVPIWCGVEPSELLAECQKKGITTIGAEMSGSIPYDAVDWKKPHLLVLGSEGHGIPEGIAGELDELASIQMSGQAESLNLAVSCGVMLFEARRQSVA